MIVHVRKTVLLSSHFHKNLYKNRIKRVTYLFSPVCVRKCRCNSSLLVNRFPQNSHLHENGRSPVFKKTQFHWPLQKRFGKFYLYAISNVPSGVTFFHKPFRIPGYDTNVVFFPSHQVQPPAEGPKAHLCSQDTYNEHIFLLPVVAMCTLPTLSYGKCRCDANFDRKGLRFRLV